MIVHQREILWSFSVLIAAFVLAAGCGKGRPDEGAGPGAEEAQVSTAEGAPEPGEAGGVGGGEPGAAESLAEREREIAAREAEVAAREAEVAQRERAAQARKAPAPRPAEAPPAEAPPAAEPEPVAVAEAPPAPEPPAPPVRRRDLVAVTVPQGTLLEVEFQTGVSSATSEVGDEVRARVARDVVVDGLVAIPAGSAVVGRVTEAVSTKKIGGKALLAMDFTRLELPSGEAVDVDAVFAGEGRSETKRDAATIGGSAAAGALIGRVLKKREKTEGTVIGAVVGAAVGTAIAAKTPGEEVEIPAGTLVSLQLEDWVRVLTERPPQG